MSRLRDIIHYFFHHNFTKATVKRVHERIVRKEDRSDFNSALEQCWQDSSSKSIAAQTDVALLQLQKKLGWTSPEQATKKQWGYWIRIAALWIIPLVSVGSSIYFFREMEEARSVAMIQYFVPKGECQRVILPDKSQVYLNGGSLLVYPEQFNSEQREVFLAGEGHFSVSSDRKSPFVVKTKAVNIQVYGTVFNIAAYPNDAFTTTMLEEGSVSVEINSTSTNYMLIPDDILSYNNVTGEVTRSRVDSRRTSHWRDGFLSFESERFETVILKIERSYGVNIRVMNPSYSANLITVNFNRNETIERVMQVIKSVIPRLEYIIEGKNIYIK